MTKAKKRVVSGMRATGEIHLGHYFGALKNWIALQEEYECFFFSAEWHALTTEYRDPSKISGYAMSNIIDWLALGLDPDKTTIFLQSRIKEHAELYLLLAMITPLGWLERNPTYKDQIKQIKNKNLSTLGFLSYPVLQGADVMVYNGELVPVGEDQIAHLELSREIVRRFNHFYGTVFKEPEALLTPVPKLPGTDGRKMSNSYGNAIFLSDSKEVFRKKIMQMMTDPARKRRQDPGNPDICPLYDLHKLFTDEIKQAELDKGCRTAAIGCVDCKEALLETVEPWHEAFLEKRRHYQSKPKLVEDILEHGISRAQKAAAETMEKVRGALNL